MAQKYVSICACVLIVCIAYIQQKLITQYIGNSSYLSKISGNLIAFLLEPIAWLLHSNTLRRGSLQLPGLKQNATIVRDEKGVPFVFAHSWGDAFFLEGFLHATERPWQLEMLRLTIEGRLSEVVGERGFSSDIIMRSLNLCGNWNKERLKKEFNTIEGRSSIYLLERYTEGITSGLQALPRYPIEFHLMRHRNVNTTWTVQHSICILRMIMLTMSRGWTIEVGNRILTLDLGFNISNILSLRKDHTIPPINPLDSKRSLFNQNGNRLFNEIHQNINTSWTNQRPIQNNNYTQDILNFRFTNNPLFNSSMIYTIDSSGSNAWVVSGNYTGSKQPIVAGDPHLALQFPGFWFPIFLTTVSAEIDIKHPLRAIGMSVPGIPGIFIGHTQQIAWSVTLNYFDLEDLFIIQLTRNGTHYVYDGIDYPLIIMKHQIYIKNNPNPQTIYSRDTHHGPLISDYMLSLKELVQPNQAIALASTALRAPLPLEWSTQMLKATSWKDIYHCTTGVQSTGLSIIFGTSDNDIGAFFTGAVPQRDNHLSVIRRGYTSLDDWKGTIPSIEIPHLLNPPNSGYIFSANQPISYNLIDRLGNSFVDGSRAVRLSELLAYRTMLTDHLNMPIEATDFQLYQMDQYSHRASQWITYVIRPATNLSDMTDWCHSDVLIERLYNEIMNWDFYFTTHSIGATGYLVWNHFIFHELFQDVPNRTKNIFLGLPIHALLGGQQEYKDHWQRLIQNILITTPGDDIYDIFPKCHLPTVLCHSLKKSVDFLQRFFQTTEINTWVYGKLTEHYIPHPISHIVPLLHKTLSIGPLQTGSDAFTVFPVHRLSNNVEELSHSNKFSGVSASCRIIMDVGNFSKSLWLSPPGISGWVKTSHATDQVINGFVNGKLYPMYWDTNEIWSHKTDVLKLFSSQDI